MQYETGIPAEEVSLCLLCAHVACTQACLKGLDPARLLRSLHFENPIGAAARLQANFSCAGCNAPC